MAPIPPTKAEKQAKKNAKAEKKKQAGAEGKENQSHNIGDPVLMNPDGSYSSLGALTPETPYATSQEHNTTASSETNAVNQVPPSASTYTFGGNTGGSPFSSHLVGTIPSNQGPSANGIFNFNISPAAPKPNYDFAVRPSSNSSSSQPPSSSIFSPLPSKPNLAFTFGPSAGPSLQQAASTNNFNFVPTSTSDLDPKLSPKVPQMLFPPPDQPTNAPALIENLNLTEILKTLNATSPGVTSTQQSDSLYKPFDIGMQMRQCHDNPDELNNCITMMEIRDAGKDAGIKRLEDELSFLQQKVKDARNMGQEIANLQIDNSKLEIKANDLTLTLAAEISRGEAKDRRIAELDRNNEAVKASAQSVHAQQAEQTIVKDAEIAELKARNSDAETTNTGITEEAGDRRISELEHDIEAIKVFAQIVHDQQTEQVTAKDEEIAKLKETVGNLITTNKGITEKAEADIEAKKRWIAELRGNRQDADDRYKALVVTHEQESLKFKSESEDKEAAVEQYREIAHVKSMQFDNLRQQVKDANLKAKKSEDHARSSDDRVEQQVKAIADNKFTISGLQATIQRLKKELQEYEEEMKSMRLEKGSESESHSDCNAQIQRLKSENTEQEQEIRKLKGSYTVRHAEEIEQAEQQYMLAQEAEIGLRHDIDMVRLRVQEHEQTIDKLQQENRRLRDGVEVCKKKATTETATMTEPDMTEKASVEAVAEDRNLLASSLRVNELSEFSPCLSVPETPESSPEPSVSHLWPSRPWRPQTESMMGDSDDGNDSEHGGEHTVTLSLSDPVTIAKFQPSDGSLGHDYTILNPVGHGLGITDVSPEMCDQGTQTDMRSSPPNLGFSKFRTILEFKPNSPALSISKPATVFESTPTSPPKLGISKPATIVNHVPSSPLQLGFSNPVAVIDHTPSSPPKLSTSILETVSDFKPNSPKLNISKPLTMVDQSRSSSPKRILSKVGTVIDFKPNSPDSCIDKPMKAVTETPSPPPKLGFSKLWTVVNLKPHSPKLSTSKPITVVDTKPLSPKFGISKIRTIINFNPDIPKASVSKPLTIDDSPSSAVVFPTPDKQPQEGSISKWQWQWLWYLFLLLMMGILAFAAFYGELARRERNMWLEANDFTRRAVISVRAGGGTGTSFPAWLWNDQLLDMTKYHYYS
ncbi:MAG: hypothetical protein Q9213_008119 [Squamulea squamosa]